MHRKPTDHSPADLSIEPPEPKIVDLGAVEMLTGHDSHGNRSDGGGTSSRYKDPGRGAGE